MEQTQTTAEGSSIDFLLKVFRENQEKPACNFNDEVYSYAWLLDRIETWTKSLESHGIRPGSIVGVTGDYSPEICSLIFALIHARCIVVPFASVTGKEKEDLANIAELQFEFIMQGNASPVFKAYDTAPQNPQTLTLVHEKAPGLIVFSSGSTGIQKGILHHFGRILVKFRVRRKTLRTLVFLQLDHLGGLNTLLYILSNCGTVISVEDRLPETICKAIQKHRIELLPVTPSFLNLLIISGEYARWDLSSLKIISYGTEVMAQATLEKVRQVFPNVQLQQTYGLSELGVLRTKSKENGSLWVKVGGEGFQTKVVDNTLWIKAHSAMVGYLNAPQPFDQEGWFNTGDEVEVDGEYIRILARQSDIINVGGQKVFPSEVESVLTQMENVKDAAVRGEKNLLMGNIVVARLSLFQPEDPEELKQQVRNFCRGKLSNYKIPMKIEITTDDLVSQRFKKVRTECNG